MHETPVVDQYEDEYILDCSGIKKSFGGTHALIDIDFKVKKGQVHALLGENGAGKSTLMKIIIGLEQYDSGFVTFEGKPYKASGVAEAQRSGISMIHQELNPEPYLSVAENIFLNREDIIKKTPFLNKKETNRRANELIKQFGFKVSPKTLIESLTLAQAQLVEILKAVSCNAHLVIMDEPTSALDNEETDRLFETIRNLNKSGVTVIYISHRMEEIFQICDSYTVFRDGHSVGTGNLSDTSTAELISLMVGHEISNIYPKTECEIGESVLKVEGLTGKGFTNICFEVHKGEILGLTGLVGAGRSETMRAIFGMDPLECGKIYLDGEEIKIRKPSDAIVKGIAMVNEDRKNFGLCLFRPIIENISLPTLKSRLKGLLINKRKERSECKEQADLLRIKTDNLDNDAFSLSGGNQQKVVLAKWILSKPRVLIMDEPTKGVDVGAKAEIHNLMCKFAAQGMAIILISSELPEIVSMSDRVLVYHEGKINGEILREDMLTGKIDQKQILFKEFGI